MANLSRFYKTVARIAMASRDPPKKYKKKKNKYSRHQTESLVGDDSSIADSSLELSSCPASPAKSVIYRGSFFTKSPSPIHCIAPSPTISRNPSFPPVYGTPRHSFSGSPIPENESFHDPIRGKAAVAKKVFVGLLKILFLIVLALGKKQFAIGITVSVFLLLILEMLGKCICRLLKHCQSAHISFRHFLEQALCNPRSVNEIERTCSIEEDPSIENQSYEEEEEKEEEEEEEETPRYTNKNPKNRNRKIKSKIKKLWISKRKQEEEEDPISDSNEEEFANEEHMEKEKKGKIVAICHGFIKPWLIDRLGNLSRFYKTVAD